MASADGSPRDGHRDAQLDAFARAPVQEGRRVRRVHPARVVLTVAIVAAVAAVLAPTVDELLFHFSKAPAVDIGDATALPSGGVVPLGARVQAHVVLGNRAAEIPVWRPGSLRFGPIIVRQVLGSPLWVEYERARHPSWGAFVAAEVDGRVVSFAPDSELAEARRLVEGQGIEVPLDARIVIADELPGQMGHYVTTWTLGLALAIWSLLSLARAARVRVVDEDATS